MNNGDTYDLLYQRLIKVKHGLITTHRTPDADGLAGELALYTLLESKNIPVEILNQEPVPDKLRFMDPNGLAGSIAEGRLSPESQHLTVISVDNSDLHRLGNIRDLIKDDFSNLIVIDHHDGSVPDYEIFFQFPQLGSTSEIIFEVIERSGFQMPPDIASAIYTGIVMDTGYFKYRKTTHRTHEIASQLLRLGVQPQKISETLQFNGPIARLRLKKVLYNSMEIDANETIAWFKITWQELDEMHLTYDDLDGMVNELIEPEKIKAGVLFTERGPDFTKISVRSKGEVDLLPAVSRFGGGGHKNACGATIHANLHDAIREFIPCLREVVDHY